MDRTDLISVRRTDQTTPFGLIIAPSDGTLKLARNAIVSQINYAAPFRFMVDGAPVNDKQEERIKLEQLSYPIVISETSVPPFDTSVDDGTH
jgi:hypothetical protein